MSKIIKATCPSCKGKGRTELGTPCKSCGGFGYKVVSGK